MTDNPSPTITEAAHKFYEMKLSSRAKATADSYNNMIKMYCRALKDRGIDPDHSPASDLSEDHIIYLIEACKDYAPSTEALCMNAASEFYQYIEAERWKPVNMSRVRFFIRTRSRRRPAYVPDYPKAELEQLIEYANKLKGEPADDDWDRLRNLRDRALIITLADTGLRIHEACNLDRGSISRHSHQAIITGKGGKVAAVRFSTRAIEAIDDYLRERAALLDGNTGKPLAGLPLFARHDKGAGRKQVKRMTTRTGDDILAKHVGALFGPGFDKEITPHTLRHRFVTKVLDETSNMELARNLARHANIQVTQRYVHMMDHELDSNYRDIFDK
jgi:integrase/recombinase XerC